MADYIVPAASGESEYTEKRSVFLGYVSMVENEQQAKDFIAQIKKKHHDARHNCWCYIIKDGPERYSDDGEPQGTAGIPMIEVFRKEGVTNVVCVVTRYFGGILLGAGGLLRAYTKAAKSALDNAGTKSIIPVTSVSVKCPYSDYDSYKSIVTSYGGTIDNVLYGENITLEISLPDLVVEEFTKKYLWKNEF